MERFSEAAAELAGLAGALLGWRPEDFWRATPAELGAVLGAMAGPGEIGASRSDLDKLMEEFPD
ncbi:MAG: phage tail assembly chaperone [Allosphingosinicella sp.]